MVMNRGHVILWSCGIKILKSICVLLLGTFGFVGLSHGLDISGIKGRFDSLDRQTQRMIEIECQSDYYKGPVQYYTCLQGSIGRFESSGQSGERERNEMDSLDHEIRRMIEIECQSDYYKSPIRYYKCLRESIDRFNSSGVSGQKEREELDSMESETKRMVEIQCQSDYYKSPIRYYKCVRRSIDEFRSSGVKPSEKFDQLPRDIKRTIEMKCQSDYYKSPIRYYRCIDGQLKSLGM